RSRRLGMDELGEVPMRLQIGFLHQVVGIDLALQPAAQLHARQQDQVIVIRRQQLAESRAVARASLGQKPLSRSAAHRLSLRYHSRPGPVSLTAARSANGEWKGRTGEMTRLWLRTKVILSRRGPRGGASANTPPRGRRLNSHFFNNWLPGSNWI